VAVEVEDDSVVRERLEGESWKAQDGCEIYLHPPHMERYAPVQHYLWGDDRGLYGSGHVEDAEVEARWETDGYRFEWRFDMERVSRGQIQLRPGMILGFDVAVWERDRDGSASWMSWNAGAGKYNDEDQLGDLVLVARDSGPEETVGALGKALEERVRSVRESTRTSTSYQMFLSGMLFAFCLLHLFLFFFYPRSNENLYIRSTAAR